MSAKLVIQRSIAPSYLWHWIIIIDNNQEWEVSKKSYRSAQECMKNATLTAIASLLEADSL